MKPTPALLCLLVLAGCSFGHHKPEHGAVSHPIPHVVAPLQGPAHDLDHQLSVASKVAVGATGIATAAGIFAVIELHISILAVAAAVGGCLGAWAMLALMRLLVPILAIGAPWAAAGVVIGLVAYGAWYWKKRKAKKAAKLVKAPLIEEPAKP